MLTKTSDRFTAAAGAQLLTGLVLFSQVVNTPVVELTNGEVLFFALATFLFGAGIACVVAAAFIENLEDRVVFATAEPGTTTT